VGFLAEIDNQMILQALGMGAHLGVTLPFSRAHELEADYIGLHLMAGAGFDPEQSINLWQNMAAQSGSQPVEFLSTHPGHDTRIEELRAGLPDALNIYQSTPATKCEGNEIK